MQNSPSLVSPYCGQNQQQVINVPATIAYKGYQYSPEEGPWAMMPYSYLYPQSPDLGLDYLPPQVSKTDLWNAMQTYPL